MKGQSYVILAIIFVIIVAVFAVTNVDAVEVNYLFWSAESPLILIILFSVLMGGIITATVGALKMYQLQREKKTLKKDYQHIEQMVKEYVPTDKQEKILGKQPTEDDDNTRTQHIRHYGLRPLTSPSITDWSGVNVCYKARSNGSVLQPKKIREETNEMNYLPL